MKYVTITVPVNEEQIISMMSAHSITATAAVEKIAQQNMKGGLGKINKSSLNEVALAISQGNKIVSEIVKKLNLQQFIDTFEPLSANKYPLDAEITREDRILLYYTISTKREAAELAFQDYPKPPAKLSDSYLWVIIAESIDNEVVVTVRPYIVGNVTFTKEQDLQGYVVTTEPHNDKNIIITISTQ